MHMKRFLPRRHPSIRIPAALVRWTCFALCAGAAYSRQVPAPADTPAVVIVSGRTTTLVDVKIEAVGQAVPATYSPTVKNTPGMSWFVSQHYALKTDRDEATARRYLTYAELAYPLHAEIIGRTPPEEERLRMPFVLASTVERMLDAVEGDCDWRPTHIGGGITYWRLNTAYNYPSGTLQSHHPRAARHPRELPELPAGLRGQHAYLPVHFAPLERPGTARRLARLA